MPKVLCKRISERGYKTLGISEISTKFLMVRLQVITQAIKKNNSKEQQTDVHQTTSVFVPGIKGGYKFKNEGEGVGC